MGYRAPAGAAPADGGSSPGAFPGSPVGPPLGPAPGPDALGRIADVLAVAAPAPALAAVPSGTTTAGTA
ncbi:hypothetical protein ACWGN8_02785 [Streptomyces sp. NPDC055768]